jgi:hypothetical protein
LQNKGLKDKQSLNISKEFSTFLSKCLNLLMKYPWQSNPSNENPKEVEDYYITPEGYKCFTEKYHLKRGYCCKSGCRHCPYGFDKKTGTLKK